MDCKTSELKVGDRVVAIKDTWFCPKGKICEIIGVTDNYIVIKPDSTETKIYCTQLEFYNYYGKIQKTQRDDKGGFTNRVTREAVKDIIDRSDIKIETLFGKCTLVAVKLPNGFVITETSSCVDPSNYDEKLGVKACMKRIEDKVFELEGYLLQEKISGVNEECREDDSEFCFSERCDTCPYEYECVVQNM